MPSSNVPKRPRGDEHHHQDDDDEENGEYHDLVHQQSKYVNSIHAFSHAFFTSSSPLPQVMSGYSIEVSLFAVIADFARILRSMVKSAPPSQIRPFMRLC
eukprot:PhM_4_TR15968/c1_g1_i14/m.45667